MYVWETNCNVLHYLPIETTGIGVNQVFENYKFKIVIAISYLYILREHISQAFFKVFFKLSLKKIIFTEWW